MTRSSGRAAILGANIRLGGEVVDELLAELAELSD